MSCTLLCSRLSFTDSLVETVYAILNDIWILSVFSYVQYLKLNMMNMFCSCISLLFSQFAEDTYFYLILNWID